MSAPTQAEDRNQQVRSVLLAMDKPIGPSRIGELVNKDWSCCDVRFAIGAWGKSAAIVPILRRIGAVGVKGKYTLPKGIA